MLPLSLLCVFAVACLFAAPSVEVARAEQPIPGQSYFGNAYNSTTVSSVTITNATQEFEVRFTARYGGTAIPRLYVSTDYYQPGAEYDVAVGVQSDVNGSASGVYIGAFVWNVSSGLCNGCGGWVYPGFAGRASPLNQSIVLSAGSVYDIVMEYYNGTFSGPPPNLYPPHCSGADCLVMQYIGGTNFQQESLDMHYDPNQSLIFCGFSSDCSTISGANAVYALEFNGTTPWQGQVENGVVNLGIGGGTGGEPYQGERFWMSWNTVSVNQLQVILSKVGDPSGSLNVIIWNFTAPSSSDIFHSSSPSVVLNQSLVANLTGMPDEVDQDFNFSLSQAVTFQTGHLYQISFGIFGNTSVVSPTNTVEVAATTNSLPALSWGGAEGSGLGPCSQYVGGCAATLYPGGDANSLVGANTGQDMIFIMRISQSAVYQPITVTMNNSAPATNVSLSGCYPTPATIPGDGGEHDVLMLPSCVFTLSLPSSGNARSGFDVSGTFSSISPQEQTCAEGTCQNVPLPAFLQLLDTYEAAPANSGFWDSNLNISVYGTQLGTPGRAGCVISAIDTQSLASCKAWFDYESRTTLENPVYANSAERWSETGGNNFTQTTGGNTDVVEYADQFAVYFSAAPAATGTVHPSGLTWEDKGFASAIAVPRAGYLFHGWSTDVGLISFVSAENATTIVTVLGPGNVTATFISAVGQPIILALAESSGTPANFTVSGCSVSIANLTGDGDEQSVSALPSCELMISVNSNLQNVRYEFASAGVASSSTVVMTCSEGTCPILSIIYYEQVSEKFSYSIEGGSLPYLEAPNLTFSSLGTESSTQLSQTPALVWLDRGGNWSTPTTLLGSTATERWEGLSGASGKAEPGEEKTVEYQREYSVVFSTSPADCGTTLPSGTIWLNSSANFAVAASTHSGCTFSVWETDGLITVEGPGLESTQVIADSNGTITALFSKSTVPFELIYGAALVAVCLVAVGVVYLYYGRKTPLN
ncbi:MAG TPA: hypothetical protein VEJ36_06185 [Nitrososphaerales archaeon]|nr:hypothetical protein [Nitrososphaerales archaeon]